MSTDHLCQSKELKIPTLQKNSISLITKELVIEVQYLNKPSNNLLCSKLLSIILYSTTMVINYVSIIVQMFASANKQVLSISHFYCEPILIQILFILSDSNKQLTKNISCLD